MNRTQQRSQRRRPRFLIVFCKKIIKWSHVNSRNYVVKFVTAMDQNRPEVAKAGRTFDSAYSLSFSIAVRLVMFIAGLVISVALGQSATIGVIFGIPLLIARLVLPLFMMRRLVHHNPINNACPYCGAPIM